jgi:hypothetical protein
MSHTLQAAGYSPTLNTLHKPAPTHTMVLHFDSALACHGGNQEILVYEERVSYVTIIRPYLMPIKFSYISTVTLHYISTVSTLEPLQYYPLFYM